MSKYLLDTGVLLHYVRGSLLAQHRPKICIFSSPKLFSNFFFKKAEEDQLSDLFNLFCYAFNLFQFSFNDFFLQFDYLTEGNTFSPEEEKAYNGGRKNADSP